MHDWLVSRWELFSFKLSLRYPAHRLPLFAVGLTLPFFDQMEMQGNNAIGENMLQAFYQNRLFGDNSRFFLQFTNDSLSRRFTLFYFATRKLPESRHMR